MTRPVILTVDDDPQVLHAVARDLRGRYGEDYRVARAESGAQALEALEAFKARNDPVALLLADQRMPRMDGVTFLSEASALVPDAKRALLTAYADTDAAIKAINQSRIHYYLLKPWDPPEEKLFPVLDDLLDDWLSGYRPPFSGVRLLGDRWSPLGHTLRDFLARSQVPYRWLDVESDPEASGVMVSLGLEDAELPAVILEDGEVLRRPSTEEVARRAGLKTQPDSRFYDVVIVGAGPAGLAAAVYGASEGLEVALLDAEAPGGQAGTSSRIENYLGFPAGLSGADLARRGVTQARKFGAEILAPQRVASLEAVAADEGPVEKGHYKRVRLGDGGELACHAVILSTGVEYRRLDLPGLDALTGSGVYYGSSMSEAMACEGEEVYVVGAGNSAGQAALFLARFAARVTILVRGDDLRAKMSQYLVEQIEATEPIEVRVRTEVASASGNGRLECLTLRGDEGAYDVRASALFVFIGASPRTEWLPEAVARDARGFVYTGAEALATPKGSHWPLERDPFLLETTVPGVFATGDVRHGSVKRVASAVGEGSIAIQFVHRFLEEVGA